MKDFTVMDGLLFGLIFGIIVVIVKYLVNKRNKQA